MEWEYTYRSARRDGWSRRRALRMFLREVMALARLSLGLHPKYRRDASMR